MKYLILINSNDLVRVPSNRIAYISSDGNYSTLFLVDKEEHLFTINLGTVERIIEEQLGEEAGIFIRLGKSLIINSEYIHYINIPRQQLILCDNHFMNKFTLSASKEALKALKNMLEENLKNK
ncbi:MAG: LytTR family transcriptional regulator DNA-binding domain-containing protein [Dysgonomonas sp.]|nr:LytTR family transcriptional regulator DNA-binding domain-containing protein [Dysgonomonas sp.]